MINQEWLNSLQEGDRVALRTHGFGRSYSIAKVTRITPTRIIKVGSLEFTKEGRQRGLGIWDSGTDLLPITQDVIDSIKKVRLVRDISNTKFSELPLDTLEKIDKILNPKVDTE